MIFNLIYINNKYIDTIHKFISPKNKLKTYMCVCVFTRVFAHTYTWQL